MARSMPVNVSLISRLARVASAASRTASSLCSARLCTLKAALPSAKTSGSDTSPKPIRIRRRKDLG